MYVIRSSIFIYLVRSRYRHLLFNSFCDISSPWPSHMPRSFGFNLTEWAHSIFPSRGWTNPGLDTYSSTHRHWKYLSHAFQTPISLVATDAVKATANDSDYAWSHSLRIKLQHLLIIATWTSWHDRVAILMLGISIIAFIQWYDLIVKDINNVHDRETFDHQFAQWASN